MKKEKKGLRVYDVLDAHQQRTEPSKQPIMLVAHCHSPVIFLFRIPTSAESLKHKTKSFKLKYLEIKDKLKSTVKAVWVP